MNHVFTCDDCGYKYQGPLMYCPNCAAKYHYGEGAPLIDNAAEVLQRVHDSGQDDDVTPEIHRNTLDDMITVTISVLVIFIIFVLVVAFIGIDVL